MSLTVTVDGTPVEVADGTTILEAAKLATAWIPTLCYDERQAPFGACSLHMISVARRTNSESTSFAPKRKLEKTIALAYARCSAPSITHGPS